MDKKSQFSCHLDPNSKLTKAASYTELTSITRKVFLEDKYYLNDGGNLIRQYSCEQVFSSSNSFNIPEKLNINKSLSFQDVSLDKSQQDTFKLPSKFQQLSLSNQTLDSAKISMSSKNIIAPPKLFIHQQTSDQSESKNDKNSNEQQSLTDLVVFKKPETVIKKKSLVSERFCSVENQSETDIVFKKLELLDTNIDEKENTAENSKAVVHKKSADNMVAIVDKNAAVEKSCNNKKFKFYCSLLLLSAVLILTLYILKPPEVVNYIKTQGYCHDRYNVKYLPLEIRKVVHGQDQAIDIISEKFLEIDKKNGFNVMSFVGGIGVGKSLVAEVIRKNLQHKNYNVIDYFPPFYKKVQDTYFSLSKCYCNLIRLENLKSYDVKDTAYFINKLQGLTEKDGHNYCILLIAIFNPQDVDNYLNRQINLKESINQIHASFQEYNIPVVTVPFKPLTEEVLLQCISDAADYTNRKLTKEDILYIKKDLINANSGCKGAYAKVQLIDKVVKTNFEL